MWKQLNLSNPVDDYCEYDANDTFLGDIQKFVSLLATTAEILTEDHPLWSEIKVFQNVQAKYKRILHCDKCLHLLQRVGTYIRKMVLLNLSKSYLDLAEPFLTELQSLEPTRLLPSRQQLEYVLIRTQSAAKLLCEALHYSRETFCYLIQRLKVGHLILNLMMATTVVARLNILFKSILVQLSDSYHKVYKWHKKLKAGAFEWSQPLELPEDLEKWLKLEGHLTQSKNLPTKELTFLKYIFEKNAAKNKQNTSEVDDEEEDDCIIIADTSQQNESSYITDTTQQNEKMDVGEVVDRDEIHSEAAVKDEEDHDVSSTTNKENSLLQEIRKAKNRKSLHSIWQNILQGNFPDYSMKLSQSKIDKISQMFNVFQQDVNKIKSERLTNIERKTQNKQVLRKYKRKLTKDLCLIPRRSPVKGCDSPDNSKPVTNLEELKELYEKIYATLKEGKQEAQCKKLRKMFKSRKSDYELLTQNGEKKLAKQLMACTSKILLAKYVM